ncbi:SIR2 family protein [Paraburkholderia aspalathi]|uniref:SIR2 family NAD-dependent protein deacylase n=1 Tax=Paraburkholderia aspalathi TaxID=1324617 RepID=UPI0038B9C767
MTKNTTAEPGKKESAAAVIERIPNGIHLHRIREALDKGHAAVMVGSGFSLNAQGGNRLTVWDGLIDKLLADIYITADARKDAKSRLGGISGMLRLAEEYAAVRGRAQLDTRLHELLPDAGVVMPGDLHIKLLSLPWSDVYTTNYDTLLERALDTDRRELNPQIKRRYQVVVAANDVPFSKSNGRPRVVKLHGSLRTGSRLIVTEEDYRSYPKDFAPFVNTVQQSMLENVFCLIGFSGDDPNFLLWTGWVRDRLGEKTPPIYLITLKKVSEGQRLILEHRNVFPIYIAELGVSDGQTDYADSLNALLDFWIDQPPPRRAEWPFHKPTRELKSLEPGVAELVAWTITAQKNRSEYPDWLIAPADNRSRLRDCSSIWRVIAVYRQRQKDLPRWLRIVLLEELAWVFETMLEPLPLAVAADIAKLFLHGPEVSRVRPMPALPDDALGIRPDEKRLDILQSHLMLALLRAARDEGDAAEFAVWKSRLRALRDSDLSPNDRCWFLHEQALFNLERRRRDNALTLLNHLQQASGAKADPYWLARVGALFGEVGLVERGQDLVRTALQGIRESIQAEGETAYLLSREQWAERLLGALNFAVDEEKNWQFRDLLAATRIEHEPRSPEVGLRETIIREQYRTKPLKPNEQKVHRNESARDNVEHPNFQTELVLREIEIAEEVLKVLTIDIDSKAPNVDRTDSTIRQEATDAAITYIRLSESAGLVPSVGIVGFTAKNLASCYRVLSLTKDANSNLRILYRANSGATLASAEALGLPSIARLTHEVATDVFERFLGEIEDFIANTNRLWDKAYVASLKFALDFVSRVAFRLDQGHARAMAELAVRLYSLPALQKEFSLQRAYGLFLVRAFRLLSETELADFAKRLLPLPPQDAAFDFRSYWPDAVEILTHFTLSFGRSEGWQSTIDEVLEQAEDALPSDNPRESMFYFTRLDWFHRHALMSPGQKRRFANLLWEGVAPGELPVIERFYRGAILSWPNRRGRPAPGDSFRAWLKDEQIEHIERPTEFNGKTVMGFSGVTEVFLVNVLLTVSNNVQFQWSESELLDVADKVEQWWWEEGLQLAERALVKPTDAAWDYLPARLRLIAHVIHRVLAPRLRRTTVEQHGIAKWLEDFWNSGLALNTPLVPLLFAGLQWWPERSETVIDMTTSVLSSNTDHHVVSAALNAAGVWLLTESTPTSASRRYVNYLVESVRSRTGPCLNLKLDSIAELLRIGCARHFESFGTALCAALNSLLLQLQDSRQGAGVLEMAARPHLRVAVVSLLAAIRDNLTVLSKEPTLANALDVAQSDSLLIVRKLLA